jgi:hypothetical protein
VPAAAWLAREQLRFVQAARKTRRIEKKGHALRALRKNQSEDEAVEVALPLKATGSVRALGTPALRSRRSVTLHAAKIGRDQNADILAWVF